jgi:hypothetical protein
MSLGVATEIPIGKTSGCADHDHDLVHELSKRLDALWRYDQYVTNAKGHTSLESLWHDLRGQEKKNIASIKKAISEEVRKGCF